MSTPPSTLPSFDLVVPIYNEEKGLAEFFSQLQALPLSFHPIFVDNASTDNSLEQLKNFPQATVIEHSYNEGYGSSIIDGIKAGSNELIVIIDADCEYPPACIPLLLNTIQNYDLVHASRFLSETSSQASMGKIKRLGNKLITFLFNLAFKQSLTDLYTGCKIIRRKALNDINLKQKGFEHVLELAAKMAASKKRLGEIPIAFQARQTDQSKMKHLPEIAKYFYWLCRYAWQHKITKL